MKSLILRSIAFLAVVSMCAAPKACMIYGHEVRQDNVKAFIRGYTGNQCPLKYQDISPADMKRLIQGYAPYIQYAKKRIKELQEQSLSKQVKFGYDYLADIDSSTDKSLSINEQEMSRYSFWNGNKEKTIDTLLASAIVASHAAGDAEDGQYTEAMGSSMRALSFDEGRDKASGIFCWLSDLFNSNNKEQIVHVLWAMQKPSHPYIAGAWLDIPGDKVLLKPVDANGKWLGLFARKCTTIPGNYEFFAPEETAAKATGAKGNVKNWVSENKYIIGGCVLLLALLGIFMIRRAQTSQLPVSTVIA